VPGDKLDIPYQMDKISADGGECVLVHASDFKSGGACRKAGAVGSIPSRLRLDSPWIVPFPIACLSYNFQTKRRVILNQSEMFLVPRIEDSADL